jgi:DNA polymerase-3 subunit chi
MASAMTTVAFHTGVDDAVGYACRLIRKAQRQDDGLRIRVEAPAPALEQLDQALWVFDAQSFVPHLRLRGEQAPPEHLHRTPVWLAEPGTPWPVRVPAPQMLLRWGLDEAVADVQVWSRVIEIVSTEAADRQSARRRWRRYEAAGAQLQHHTA